MEITILVIMPMAVVTVLPLVIAVIRGSERKRKGNRDRKQSKRLRAITSCLFTELEHFFQGSNDT